MIDILEMQKKLHRIFVLGEHYGVDGESDRLSAMKRCDKWWDTFNDLKQEILWEIEILNLEAEKNSSPSLGELISQLGGIKEVSGVVK